jgi:DNA-binding MarR family transcriptional regulator
MSVTTNIKIFAKKLVRQTEIRSQFFPPEICSDAAWSMLLDLYISQTDLRSVSVGSLCIAGNVPNSTGLRWISLLIDKGLIQRYPDPRDRRRILVRLTEKAASQMEACLTRMAQTDAAFSDPRETARWPLSR